MAKKQARKTDDAAKNKQSSNVNAVDTNMPQGANKPKNTSK